MTVTPKKLYHGRPLVAISPPAVGPILSQAANTTILQPATLYVVYTWSDGANETLASPEVSLAVAARQELVISTDAIPNGATQANVYVGTAAGAETLQGDTKDGAFTLSAALTTNGEVPPAASSLNGVADPANAPVLAVQNNAAILQAGTYYLVETYVASNGSETLASPETSIAITAGNELTADAGALPADVTAAKLYISTQSGQEALWDATDGTLTLSDVMPTAGPAPPVTVNVQSIYSVPVSVKQTVVRTQRLANMTGEEATITLYVVPQGQSYSDDNGIAKDYPIPARSYEIVDDVMVLEPGDTIQAVQGAQGAINVYLSGVEIS